MKLNAIKIVTMAVLASFSPMGAMAAEHDKEAGHGEHGEHHKHELALFAGITREHDENLETLGIEYGYRIHPNWSIGGLVERADREEDSTLVIVFAHWWPYKGLILGAGIGRKDPGGERENTIRTTLGYEFELGGGWGIAPQVHLDVIDGHDNEEVYGITLGKHF